MASSVAVEVPVAESVLSRYEVAAQVFDRAVQAGCQDPNVFYLLAMAHKRQGKTADARNALRKIPKPSGWRTALALWTKCYKAGLIVQGHSRDPS